MLALVVEREGIETRIQRKRLVAEEHLNLQLH
jgi:hypothetical protein